MLVCLLPVLLAEEHLSVLERQSRLDRAVVVGRVRAGRVAAAYHRPGLPADSALEVYSVGLERLSDVVVVDGHLLHRGLSEILADAEELDDVVLGCVRLEIDRFFGLVYDIFDDHLRAVVRAVFVHA